MNASSAFRPTSRHFVARIEDEGRPGVAARNRVQRGQVFRARQELTGAAFAPETAKTLVELRRQRLEAEIEEIPPEMMEFQPAAPLNLDPKVFHSCLSGAPVGVAPSPGGCTNEMLDDIETTQLLFRAVEDLAKGEVPEITSRPLVLAALTVLEKQCGRVTGIAIGLARQFSQDVERHALRFSMRCPPEPEPIALGTLPELQPRQTPG